MPYKNPEDAREFTRRYRKGLTVPKRPKNAFSPYAFAFELEDLLEIPRTVMHYANGQTSRRPKKGTQIIYTILDTMKAALQRGEKVYIHGFGTFKVVTRKPRNARNMLYGSLPGGQKLGQNQAKIQLPAKKVVVFRPAAGLDVLINTSRGYSPGAHSTRTLKYWERDANRKR